MEELHAASLSGKRLLALWNALPGVEKRRKVGDRAALIDQLWAVVEMLPERNPTRNGRQKQCKVMAMLRRPEVATVDDRHSVPLVRDVMAAILVRLEWHGDYPGSEMAALSYTVHSSPPTTDPCNKIA